MAANYNLSDNNILIFVFFPFFFLMAFLLVLGSFFRVSRVSWFGVWGGIELNIICFIPLVIHFSSFIAVEGVVKYFLVQSLGSIGVLFGGLMEDSFFFSGFASVVFFFVGLRLLIKIGVFPFHW